MPDLLRLGPKGEDHALELLRARGLQLLERNFRCPQGEIDLVMWHGDTLVFVEVRTRTEGERLAAAQFIRSPKQARIVRAAKWYLARRWRRQQLPNCRFDVVWLSARGTEIVGGGVIEGAFTA